MPTACITLDLESDYASLIPTAYTGWDHERIEFLLAMLKDHGAPLTVFVVAESLGARPEVIERFRRAGAEFHLHSFSHDLAHPDSREEVVRGREVFEAFFGHPPEGYRAPQGRISPEGWRTLEEEGFLFDSSLFPSFWPSLRYLKYPQEPFQPSGCRLLVLPIATLTRLRLIVSMSWFKLLGWPLYRQLLRGYRPEPLVFDMHLHDLWAIPSYQRLALSWRLIYGRERDRGLPIFARFLDLLSDQGYHFATLSQVARTYQRQGRPC